MSLQDLIRNHIQKHGAMPFDTFQEWALYYPQLGYYNTQAIFGEKGDFITSPEISQMFGEMVGLWLLDLWHQMGSPSSLQLIELGPGRGTFMADILRMTRLDAAFSKALQIHLVEISPLLKVEQQGRLAGSSVTWFSSLDEALLEGKGPLFVVANEFFDAIPTKQYQKRGGIWEERFVDWNENLKEFFFTTRKTPLGETPIPPQGKEGDIWEISPNRDRLFHQLIQSIQKRQGVLWICDYGYTEATLLGDSVQGIYRQEKSAPLVSVGLSDLSSHVSFGRFKEIAKQMKLADLGPVGQGNFLKALGIGQRLTQLKQGKSPEICAKLQAEYERLTNLLQMGILFQVYTVYNPDRLIPCGFERIGENAVMLIGEALAEPAW